MRRFGSLMKLTIVVLILAIPHFAYDGTVDVYGFAQKDSPVKGSSTIWSLSGTESIERASSRSYIGERNSYAQAPGGHLGECIWTGDLNGDGDPDLGIAAPQLNGTDDLKQAGRFYVFYGPGDMSRGIFDLSSDTPDLIILGGREQCGLLDSFTIGDIDGDGLTDLILGVPVQDSCGRVYVLWGKGPWTGTKTLVDPGRLSPDGPQGGYGFLTTNDYAIIAGDLAPVPAPSDNYEVGRVVRCADLDSDGYDDLVFSTPGWNKVNIVWGSSDRLDLGDELTIIDDTVDFGRFGECAELGDINGNGLLDLVATAPIRNDEQRVLAQVGSVFVIMDVGRIKGNASIMLDEEGLVKPMIVGSDPYDKFGMNLLLKDLNGDGKDDIIVGATESDGSKDDSDGAGSIHVFLGGQSNQFPLEMDAESGAEWVVFGQMMGYGQYPGDQLGSAIALPDFDGDSKPDLVVSLPDRNNGTDQKTGVVLGYPAAKVFTSSKKNIEIGDITERFQILGVDPYDRIGFRLAWADWDKDGTDDIFVASPSSDGGDNERKECGEVHLIYGTSISIERIWLSGPGMIGDQIACGYGTVDININVTSNSGISAMGAMSISIPYMGASMSFKTLQGSIPEVDSQYGMLRSEKGIGLIWSGLKGTVTVHATFEWWFPGGVYDILVMTGPDNKTRTFPRSITTINSVVLEGSPVLQRNGMVIPHQDMWFGLGDEVNISGIRIAYDGKTRVMCKEDAPFVMQYSESGVQIGLVPANGEGYISLELTSIGVRTFSILPMIEPSRLPSGLPSKFMPKTFGGRDISIRVDGEVPQKVDGLRLLPDEGEGTFDDDRSWNVTWNPDWLNGDVDSGVRHYVVGVTGASMNRTIGRSAGGLMGTYYNDDRFGIPAQVRIDRKMEFDWGRFPPITDIVPEGYSIRWHGWLDGPAQGNTRFTLSGKGGNASVFIDDQELLQWGDLSERRISRYIGLTSGALVPVEIYFRQSGDSEVVFNLRWEDVAGDPVEIPQTSMFHPSNMTGIRVTGSGPFDAIVEAVDWVGLRSDVSFTQGIVDDVPPELNLTEYRSWLNATDARISFSCSDPGSELGLGSGIEKESIRYRIKESSFKEYGLWKEDDIWSINKDRENYIVQLRTELRSDFRGSIQFRASDNVGNIAESGSLSLGVDLVEPKFNVVEPSLVVHHVGTTVTFYVRVTDSGGSGVDGSTIKMRTRTNSTEWSEWYDIGVLTSGEEVAAEFQREISPGWNRIQFSAVDLVGNEGSSEEYTLVVKAKVVDRPPEVVIDSPENGTVFTKGTPVLLDGSSSKDDGIGRFETLRYTWSSNRSGYIGSGKSMKINDLSLGWHRITLYVDDGTPGHNVSGSVEIMIKPVIGPIDGNNTDDDDDKTPYLLYLAIIAGIILVFIVMVIVVIRRRSETADEEVKIEYRVSSTSDLEYDERLAEEEKGIGLDIGPSPPLDPDEERRKLYGED